MKIEIRMPSGPVAATARQEEIKADKRCGDIARSTVGPPIKKNGSEPTTRSQVLATPPATGMAGIFSGVGSRPCSPSGISPPGGDFTARTWDAPCCMLPYTRARTLGRGIGDLPALGAGGGGPGPPGLRRGGGTWKTVGHLENDVVGVGGNN